MWICFLFFVVFFPVSCCMELSRVLKNMAVGWILAFQAFRLFWPTQLHTQKVGWLSPWFSLLLCFISPTAVTESFSLTPSLCHSVRLPLSLCQFLPVYLFVFFFTLSVCLFLSVYLSVSVFFLVCVVCFTVSFCCCCCLAVYHFLSFFLSFHLWLLINCFSVFVSVSVPHSLILLSPPLFLSL